MSFLHTILLNNPDELLAAVIEDQRDVNGGDVAGHGVRRSKLELVNQIFVIRGDEAFTFFGI
jgi:hypothetical protein